MGSCQGHHHPDISARHYTRPFVTMLGDVDAMNRMKQILYPLLEKNKLVFSKEDYQTRSGNHLGKWNLQVFEKCRLIAKGKSRMEKIWIPTLLSIRYPRST